MTISTLDPYALDRVHVGDCLNLLSALPDESVQCIVTSPPYWGLRDYGVAGQLGLESTPEEYVAKMVEVFREARRVLTDDGTLWLNLGDSYCSTDKWGGGKNGNSGKHTTNGAEVPSWAVRSRKPKIDGIKPKDLVGIPWRVAFALQADGWWLRSDIIWHKSNPMPESVTDRPTKAHEYVFLLAKSERYWYDKDAVMEPSLWAGSSGYFAGAKNASRAAATGREPTGNEAPGAGRVLVGDARNRRSVWTIATQPFPGAHFAVMPPALVEPCILAGRPEGGIVLDPFAGAGTVAVVAARLGRRSLGFELNPEYAAMANGRIAEATRQGRLPVATETTTEPQREEQLTLPVEIS